MKYLVVVNQNYFKDNYTNGEISGTFTRIKADEKIFNTPEEAYQWFVKTYNGGVIEVIDYGKEAKINSSYPLQQLDEYGFHAASKEELELWKNDEINLWNVEYELSISELRNLTFEEMENLWKNNR